VPPVDLEYAWVQFAFPWDAQPGTHVLLTKPTDKKDKTQPERVPFNEMGILCNVMCNVMPRFEIRVG
jgi:hypothetical protein